MVNRKERRRLTCRGCGKQRVIADAENKLCGACAALFQDGELTEDMLKPLRPAKGGRPHAKPAAEEPPKYPDRSPPAAEDPDPEGDPDPDPDPGVNSDPSGYACEICNRTVRRGQRKCQCGAWLDWRGTDLETDPDIVVCPRCGAICGYVDACSGCPHCGFEGD